MVILERLQIFITVKNISEYIPDDPVVLLDTYSRKKFMSESGDTCKQVRYIFKYSNITISK